MGEAEGRPFVPVPQTGFRVQSYSPTKTFDLEQMAEVATWLQSARRLFLELAAVLLPLLGYFLCMITVWVAAAGAMIGSFNTSTSERVHHYPRPVIERNVTATNGEPRLFMVVPETKDGSPAKMEANSPAVATENAEAKEGKPHKPKVLAHQHSNKVLAHHRDIYEQLGDGNALGYAQQSRNGPQRLLSNW